MDDAAPTQFQIRADGTIDPHSAVGILARLHPPAIRNFPIRGTFYVLPPIMWAQRGMAAPQGAPLEEVGQ